MVMTADQITQMKKHAEQVVLSYGVRDNELYTRFREMYFMEDEKKRPLNPNVDEKDWAITISPSTRNKVIGMVRLLDTGEIHITAKAKGEKADTSDKIEAALKAMLRVSGEYRRARVESDAALSAALYGPVVLYSESVADLREVNAKDKFKARQLGEVEKRTPFLIRSINPEQSYPEWGEFGIISHTWKYKVKGSVLKDRWGVEAKHDQDYTVYDIYDPENRLVYADGIKEPLFADAHGLDFIPIVSRYAGGSSLFFEPEKQVGSFLYATAKSRLDKRENALLTAIATSINMRGLLGPLLSIDMENQPETINVEWVGGVRFIKAKAQQVDDKVIDPVVFQWRQLLREIEGESTIQNQTLGAANNQGTFSGLAMLASAGKLPLVDSQRAIEMAFRDVFLNILQRIKAEGIASDLIQPIDIPDDVELEVSLEPNLPQDKLRNAQVAQSLGDLVSDEWKHSQLLQIGDSNEMRKQITKETILKAILGAIVQDQTLMQQMVGAAMGMPKTPPPTPPQMEEQFGEGSPQGMPPEMMQAMMAQQGQGADMAGMEGMEGMPQTEPMTLPQERM